MLRHHGYTLTELLIALALSGMGLITTSSLMVSTSTQLLKLDQLTRLQNELHLIAAIVSEDVRNAGFDGLAQQRLNDKSIPPSPFQHTLAISAFASEPADSCIVFTHDVNANGQLNNQAPNERRGYRLRDGAIEVRMAGRSCTQAGWQDLTNTDEIIVDSLLFADNHQHGIPFSTRHVSVTISASLATNPRITRQITLYIELGNRNG